jgi:two-component system copper resistance phosphate regulon response regulator CusR
MCILIVGGDSSIGKYLAKSLAEASFVADWTAENITGQRLARAGDYDLIILASIYAKEKDWAFLQKSEGSARTPLLLLTTGHDSLERDLPDQPDRSPPIDLPALLTRIRSILGIPAAQNCTVLRVADMQLDLVRRRAVRHGKAISLTAKEFSLLWLLMQRSGEILPRSIIASQVWGINFVSGTNFVEVMIKRLRTKIDADCYPKLIHTVRNMGYVLEDRGARAPTEQSEHASSRIHEGTI